MIPILRDTELALFEDLVRQARPHRVLEIGTAIGYSALRMAPLLADGGSIITIEIDPERAAAARSFISRSPYAGTITLLEGDATPLAAGLNGPWDFVFLDGPKGQYSRQLSLLMPKLSPEALIIADNVRYHGMVAIKGTIPHKHRTIVMRLREYIRMVTEDPRFQTKIYDEGDGMAVSHWKKG